MKTTTHNAGSLPRIVRWFSIRKPFTRCWVFGFGVGWDRSDWTATLLIQFGPWLVLVGPHLSPNTKGQP